MKKNNNKMQAIEANQTETNAVRFYQLMTALCGKDYKTWLKHDNYELALQTAHDTIFPTATDDAETLNGLRHAVQGLQYGATYVLERRTDIVTKRKNMYKKQMMYAHQAGLISDDAALQGLFWLDTLNK